jgi:hypothetical protein
VLQLCNRVAVSSICLTPSGAKRRIRKCCAVTAPIPGTLLFKCCDTVVKVLLHCCYIVVTLLLHCCYSVVTLLCRYCSDSWYTTITPLEYPPGTPVTPCNAPVTLSTIRGVKCTVLMHSIMNTHVRCRPCAAKISANIHLFTHAEGTNHAVTYVF